MSRNESTIRVDNASEKYEENLLIKVLFIRRGKPRKCIDLSNALQIQ